MKNQPPPQPSQELTWWKIGTVIFAMLFIITLGTFLLASQQQNKITGQTTKKEISEVTIDDDPSLGDEDSSVTMIEFSDFQCPSCKQFWSETFPLIKQHYIATGKVRFVFRDFPMKEFGHVWSMKAAEAAECANNQGKFWEMQDKIFNDQHVLNSLVREVQHPEEAQLLVTLAQNGKTIYVDIAPAVEHLKLLAAQIHLNTATLNECLDAGKEIHEVEKDKADAEKAGVTGTPTFFINGEKIPGSLPLDAYQKIIERELFK